MKTVFAIQFACVGALLLTAVVGGRGQPQAVPAANRPDLRARLASAAALRFTSNLSRKPAAIGVPMPSLAMPLSEHPLSPSRRAEPISPDLRDAMDRMEPIYDPTRLEGPFTPVTLRVWPGSASPTDVFGEHWRLASADPNVQAKVPSSGSAWARATPMPCEAFIKNRPHAIGTTALSDLTGGECADLRRRQARHGDDAAPLVVVAAVLRVPAFAAPPPGARMSSRDFWAQQRARVTATRDYLQHKWQTAQRAGARP